MKRSQIMTVAGFTFREQVRKKAFWVTNIIYIVLIIAAAFLLPNLGGGDSSGMDISNIDMEAISGGGFEGAICYLLDESDNPRFFGMAGALRDTGMLVVEITAEELDATLERIAENNHAALLQLFSGEELASAIITTQSLMHRFPAPAMHEIIQYVYRYNQFTEAGYDMEITQNILLSGVAVGMSQMQDVMNMIVGFALVFLMFMAIYTYGAGFAMSVATEKSTRVMETLIVSAKPSRILVGKCVGMGAVGLSQLLGILSMFALSARLVGGGGGLSLPAIGIDIIALLVLYFLLGYALFAMINSMCGALVSKMEDINSAMMPAMIVAVVSFYAGGYVPIFGGATADISRLVLLIPFTAPFAAPGILLGGEPDFALIAASVGLLLIAIAVVSWISGKVYSASVLHYGSRLKLGDLRRMLRKK